MARYAAIFHVMHSLIILIITFTAIDYGEKVTACSTPELNEMYHKYLCKFRLSINQDGILLPLFFSNMKVKIWQI